MSLMQIFTFWKGRVALYAILKALDIGAGDAVLMPGYTCMVVPSAVAFLGARPVYADVAPDSYNVTRATLEAAWRKHRGPRPRAVIIQHTYGIPVEAGPIIDWARDEGLAVVEDCAHVLASSYRGTPCGQLGDAAFFSSQWNKPVTTGLGGWCTAGTGTLSTRLGRIRQEFSPPGFPAAAQVAALFFIHRLLYRPQFYWPLMHLYRAMGRRGLVVSSSSPEEFEVSMPQRYTWRMSTLQERLLEKALGKVTGIIAHRQVMAEIYARELSQAGWATPGVPPQASAIFVRYPVQVKDKAGLLRLARENRMELGDWFVSPLHPLTENLEKLGYRTASCPVAEELCQKVINFPTHPRITAKEAFRIVHAVMHY